MSESIENAGDKIAAALQQNSTSWVAAKIASLYWRVKGRAQEALECLRVALTYAPDSAKVSGRIEASATFRRKLHLSKMSPCPDPNPNSSGWWLKMWTYRLVFYGINFKILR